MITLAEAVPEDHTVVERFRGTFGGESVLVTAVLERTCVIQRAGTEEKQLINKRLLLVEEGFTLAVVDEARVAMRSRVARGWRTNWQRREAK